MTFGYPQPLQSQLTTSAPCALAHAWSQATLGTLAQGHSAGGGSGAAGGLMAGGLTCILRQLRAFTVLRGVACRAEGRCPCARWKPGL
jgi:hypothetical protein